MSAPSATKIDLLLLGLLLDRPMHGYELFQLIHTSGIDIWFNISMAGVYYSLGKLRTYGYVAESSQHGGRSARKSIFRITDEGRTAFFSTMESQASSQDKIYLDYDVVIFLMNKLPLQTAVDLLQQHMEFLGSLELEAQAALSTERETRNAPLALAILEHRRRYLEMEQIWLNDVIRDIQGEDEGSLGTSGERLGLMVLSGDLRNYHLPDLLRLIASGKHSGTLKMTDGDAIRTMTFEEGRPVCASVRTQGEDSAFVQTPEEVIEELCGLFRWQEGRFTFDQEVGCDNQCVPLQIRAEDLILCGCRWVDNWAIIERLIPSADTILELGVPSEHLETLSLTAGEQQIVNAIDGVKDIATIAREVGQTVFDASRAFYCLVAIGVVRTADQDKIRLRRVFREFAELMCSSTVAWRSSPDDRTCEHEVNERTAHLPLCLNRGRIADQADPQLRTEDLVDMYRSFLRAQLDVVSKRFGRENARRSFERTLQQLAPELQDAARRYGFDKLLSS